MKKFFIKKLFGYRYLINNNTREIHDIKNHHENCQLEIIVDKKLIRPKKLNYYLESHYNGCRWCFKQKDNG